MTRQSSPLLARGLIAVSGLAALTMMALPASYAQDAASEVSAQFAVRKTTNTSVKFGVAAFNEGDFARAVNYNQKAIAAGLSPKRRAVAFSNLCASLGALGDFSAALSACDSALTLRPDMIEALNNRGLVRQAQGDSVAANEDFAAARKAKG